MELRLKINSLLVKIQCSVYDYLLNFSFILKNGIAKVHKSIEATVFQEANLLARLQRQSSDTGFLKYRFTRSKKGNCLSSWADDAGRYLLARINNGILYQT